MTMYPHTITVINTYNVKGVLSTFKTVISGVLYQDNQKVRTGSIEHISDNKGYVQIPESQLVDYVTPEEWLKLSDKSSKWTIKNDDFILKGETTETDYNKINAKRTIESHEYIDYGIFLPKHIGITLK